MKDRYPEGRVTSVYLKPEAAELLWRVKQRFGPAVSVSAMIQRALVKECKKLLGDD